VKDLQKPKEEEISHEKCTAFGRLFGFLARRKTMRKKRMMRVGFKFQARKQFPAQKQKQ